MNIFLTLSALFGAIGVAAGAFGAHGLESTLDADALEVWHTAVRYQMYHALALLGTAWVTSESAASSATAAGWLFVGGILVFSGTLYALALTDIKWLGAITPLGGLALIAGWVALLVASL